MMDEDKSFLKSMMASITKRVEAMLNINGGEVHKENYPSSSGDG